MIFTYEYICVSIDLFQSTIWTSEKLINLVCEMCVFQDDKFDRSKCASKKYFKVIPQILSHDVEILPRQFFFNFGSFNKYQKSSKISSAVTITPIGHALPI